MRDTVVSGLVFLVALATPVFGQSLLGNWTATAETGGAACPKRSRCWRSRWSNELR
jgi:hypothetical protein